MKQPPKPENESQRQAALDESGLLNAANEERFDRITRLACRMFSVPIALVSLVDRERQWFKSCQGLSASETPRGISFCGHAILSNEPLIVENALEDERFFDNPLVSGAPHIRFYAGIPLHTKKGFRIGTLCLIDSKPRDFSPDDVSLLRDMGSTVESIIHIDEDQRQSKTSYESALLDSERRARLVVEGTGVGTWQWNVQTGETVFNSRWAEIVGYTLEELEPISIDTWMGLAHPDDWAQSEALLTAHFSGQARFYDCKARMRHKHGHWIWVHDRGQVFEWTADGKPLLMYGTHADITAEVEAQHAVKKSADELAALVSNMHGVTFRCLADEHWTMLYLSCQIDSVSGYSADELINNASICYAQLIHPDDAEWVGAAVSEAINLGQNWHIEYRIRHRDGSWRWVEERGHAIADDAVQFKVLEGFIVDITREHKAKTQLKKNHNALVLLNKIVLNAHVKLDDRIAYALDEARKYLDMDMAVASQVEGDRYTVRWVSQIPQMNIDQGVNIPLGNTWCQLLFSNSQHELFMPNVQEEDFASYVCYKNFQLGAYFGIFIFVEGKIFGTLNFSRALSRDALDDSEILFIRLLARWLGGVIESSASSERLSKLLEHLPGVVYQYRLFPDGHANFPFASHNIEQLYGISPEQAAVDAVGAFSAIHPADLDRISQSIHDSAANLTNWHAIYRVRAGLDGFHWVSGQARPEQLPDGSILWHGYIHDINEQEEARQAIERNEARLRSLFDFSPIGIALNDYKTGQFITLNNALLKPTGYTQDEFVRLSYWDVTPIKYEPEEQQALEDLKNKGSYGPFEKEYIRKDGSRYPVRLQGMLSQDPDGRAVIWSLVEDISERRRLDKMKDEFIATVSHELRTPLTAINGSIGLLLGGAVGAVSEKGMSLLDNALRNGRRLAQLINDLLDMEKLVAGKMSMNLAAQPIGPLIEEAVDSIANYGKKGVTIDVQDACADVKVFVDGERLIQVFNNLLSNAIKFSPSGSPVRISTEVAEKVLIIRVRDHGSGVAPEFQGQLFKRFSQADGSDARRLPGTGLGLAITKEICHQFKAEVNYRDAEGGGSEFYISLPVVS